MAWYRVEMEADENPAIAVEVPSEDCDAVESFMQKCAEQTQRWPAWSGGHWTLHGPYKSEEVALDGWFNKSSFLMEENIWKT